MSNPSLQVALGSVSIALEDAATLEDLKSVIGDLITALDDNLCAPDPEAEEGGET